MFCFLLTNKKVIRVSFVRYLKTNYNYSGLLTKAKVLFFYKKIHEKSHNNIINNYYFAILVQKHKKVRFVDVETSRITVKRKNMLKINKITDIFSLLTSSWNC